MDLLLLLNATILSTTTMTLFSYAVSKSFRDLYVEPVLLEYMISRLHFRITKKKKMITARILHYVIGLFFVLAYFFLIEANYIKNNWVSGIIFGSIIGLLGIIGWKTMFTIAGKTPIQSPAIYYLQLFLAHIIFALTMVYSFYVIYFIKL